MYIFIIIINIYVWILLLLRFFFKCKSNIDNDVINDYEEHNNAYILKSGKHICNKVGILFC